MPVSEGISILSNPEATLSRTSEIVAPVDLPNLPVNVNYVYGTSDDKPQGWMSPNAWFAFMMIGLPLVFYIPTHLLLKWLMGPAGVVRPQGLAPREVIVVEVPSVEAIHTAPLE